MSVKDIVVTTLVGGLVLYGAYTAGFNDATARHEIDSKVTMQIITDALSRGDDALSVLKDWVSKQEGADAKLLEEIENAERAAGTICTIPVDRLRRLDAIAD